MTEERREYIKERRKQLEANAKSVKAVYDAAKKELDEALSDLRLECDHEGSGIYCAVCGAYMGLMSVLKDKVPGKVLKEAGIFSDYHFEAGAKFGKTEAMINKYEQQLKWINSGAAVPAGVDFNWHGAEVKFEDEKK